MMKFFLLFLTGGLGTVARYSMSLWTYSVLGAHFPFGTLITNILGSFLISIIVPLAMEASRISMDTGLLLTVGFLGGFTSYSSFNFESLTFFAKGEYVKGFFCIGTMLGLCLLSGAIGLYIARRIMS